MTTTKTTTPTTDIDSWDLDAIRKQIGRWLNGTYGSHLASILAAQRGPDSPSERGDMSPKEFDVAYWGRRARKASSGEAIRGASFFGIGHVGCRTNKNPYVTLPPHTEWDHYDKHMADAAGRLGLEVIISETAPSAKKAIWKK